MKPVVSIILLVATCLAPSLSANGQEIGSATYCSQLAEIGSSAYQTKTDGYAMGQVLQIIGQGLQDNPQKKIAAQGVVVAVYGDSSIKSSSQAYKVVYSACKR